jgi:hypothetical protein
LLHAELIVGPRLTGDPQGPNLFSAAAGVSELQVAAITSRDGAMAAMKIDAFMSEPSLETGTPF